MKNCILFLFLLSACFASAQQFNIIPRPANITPQKGNFTLSRNTIIVVNDEAEMNTANFLIDYIKHFYGLSLKTGSQPSTNYISLSTKRFIQPGTEGKYSLVVKPGSIHISGDTYQGTFYGAQSLLQLIPVSNTKSVSNPQLLIPSVVIDDQPRFEYRGLHLDVSRHFAPVAFVKKYIDYIALHKMNYFHWHLTEDQGWRIEIKKYPRLTEVGGYRNGTIIGRYPGKGNDNIPYGGFYTQEEVKEVVDYAAKRFVTVVPEIEMPGHSSAAIAAYPWLSCFPDEKTAIPPNMISEASSKANGKLVQETWGVFDDVFCAGDDSTFAFLQDVIDEILPLFPGQYIHVGGDECPKNNWKRCPSCQKRIKDLNLKDEHELQSYFIQRMEKYINGKGKTIIGWDEILEGGLAPNAIVMSWRGEKGGIDAARENHKVIMTPGNYVYLDHSQTKNEDSVTIGGHTPVDEIYGYEPIPKELAADKAKYVLGAQGNVWTEYMKNTKKVEYQIFPRLSALSEVLWSPKELRNFKDFERRLPVQFKRYELWGTNYSKAYNEIRAAIIPTSNYDGVQFKLETNQKSASINTRSHLPGESWVMKPGDGNKYAKPLMVKKSGSITAWTMVNGQPTGNMVSQKFSFNKATGKKISLAIAPASDYPGNGGAFGLVNGAKSEKGITSSEWLGWRGKDMEAVIDLGKSQKVSLVTVHVLNRGGSRVYTPADVIVSGSVDGKNFIPVGNSSAFIQDASETSGNISIQFNPTSFRYIRIIAKNYPKIPEGRTGAGDPALMLIDEIGVE